MQKNKWFIIMLAALFFLGGIALFSFFARETFRVPVFYVANAGDGTISKIDVNKSDPVNSLAQESDQLSHGIAISPDQKTVYFGSGSENKLYAFDTEVEEVISELLFDESVHGIDIHPSGKYVYVSLSPGLGEAGGELAVIDTEDFVRVASITTDDGPAHVSVSADGSQVWVTNVNGNTVSAIDAYTYQVLATIPVGEVPNEVALSPKLDYAFSANVKSNSVSVIDMNTFEVIDEITVGEGVHGVAVSLDGQEVWTANNNSNDVSVIDTETLTFITAIETGSYANHISFSPDGDFAFVTNRESNNLVVIDRKEKTVIKELKVGEEPHEMTLKGMTATIEQLERSEQWEQYKQERYRFTSIGEAENIEVKVRLLSPYSSEDAAMIADKSSDIDAFEVFALLIDMTTHSGDITSVPLSERIGLENEKGERLEPAEWIVLYNDAHHPQFLAIFDKTIAGKPLLENASSELYVDFAPFINEGDLKIMLLH